MSDPEELFESPPEQSPPGRLSESGDVPGRNASKNSALLEEIRDAEATFHGQHCSSPFHCECGCGAHMGCFITGDYAAGVPLNSVDEAVFRRISEGERDRNGNLIWLREDGKRR